jgi:hypothetical protein
MSNNRRWPDTAPSPSAEDIRKERLVHDLTVEQAAALIWYTPKQWLAFESGERRMHPCTWWAFQKRVKGVT